MSSVVRLGLSRVGACLGLLGLAGLGCGGPADNVVDTLSANTLSVNTLSVDTLSGVAVEAVESTTTVVVELPTVVVTYSALESVVSEIVGDAARVVVVIPNGTDPHDFEPSAKDVEVMSSAAVVVSNGLGLEARLEDALTDIGESGVPVFRITDHVTLRTGATEEHSHGHSDSGHSDSEHSDSEHSDKDGEASDAEDPHVWLDPLTLAEAVPALAKEIGTRIGVDLTAAGSATAESLVALNSNIDARIKELESCIVITGHDSLGYFGARYGCEVLGSIIPSFSTAAEATAKDLAELKQLAKTEGVRAIFTELGTPTDVADQLAREVGVEVVEIATHVVPDGGGYDEMMISLTDAIVSGLS
jgi:zinc/manganese transport system substrate-binding protein